jgi:hypothetical protein
MGGANEFGLDRSCRGADSIERDGLRLKQRIRRGLCPSFEARKGAHLPSERKRVRPGTTQTVRARHPI